MDKSTAFRISVQPYVEKAKMSGIKFTDEEIGRYITTALRSSCEIVRDYARTHHKFRNHTGKLQKGIKYDVSKGTRSRNISSWYGKVGYVRAYDRPEYAKWQMYGTGLYGEHETSVVPRFAKYLKFQGINPPYTGKWYSLKSARGIKGDNYIRNALVKMKKQINTIFETELQNLIMSKQK